MYQPQTAHIASEKARKSLAGSICNIEPARVRTGHAHTIFRIPVYKRTMTITIGKTKCIAIAMLFSCIALIFMASAAYAQENKKERGYNGPITKAKLLSEFQNNKGVEGYVIEGSDIISIIEETDYDIKINNSIIKGGLDFTILPEVSIDKLSFPEKWSEKEKEEFKKKRKSDAFCIVNNSIEIINSEIQKSQPEEENAPLINAKSVLNAKGTFFYKDVNFSKATFSRGGYFSWATFSGVANFSMATFSEDAYFSCATFSGLPDFTNVTFSGRAYFSDVTFANFRSAADFSNATFSRDACFSCTTFSGGAYFFNATFSEEADFSNATFHRLNYFKEARVKTLLLDSTTFKEYADFRETVMGKLDYKCTFPTTVEGHIDFRNSRIYEAHFQDIIFENDVDFSDVKFGIPLKEGKTDGKLATVFRYVTFESDANFIRTEFHSDTAFERIKFKGDANFTDIAFKDFKHRDQKKFSLSYFTFKHLLLSMDDLPGIQHWVRDDKDRIRSFVDVEDNKANKNLQPLTKVLYSLEEVFHSQNNLNDANKAYYYRKLMELEDTRLMKHVDTSKNITSWQRVWGEVEWYFWGLPCGYATSWKKIVLWCGGFYLFFVILYNAGGKLTKTYQEEEDEFRMRLFVLPIKYLFHESEVDFVPNEYVMDHKEGWGKFIGALKFSMVIFFKIGYIDTKISGKILRIDAKYFVWSEWVIGYWLLAALLVTLSNTLPIVHRLISGIF